MKDRYEFRLEGVEALLLQGKKIDMAELPMEEVRQCYEFLKGFASEKVIYGINTGFGPMAQWRVDDQYLIDLQYNIIRSHSTGAGEPLPDLYVKASMIARLGTFLQARSGVHPDLVKLLVGMINADIIPFIPQHGSVGASGDLVQLAHMALTMIGEGKVHYKGEWRPSAEVLRENGLEPFKIHIREGLSISNGTSFMTGIGVVNQIYAERLLDWATLASVMMNEIASSFDDLMSEELNSVRRHEGQQVIARRMRELADGSGCLQKREHELYDNGHSGSKTFEHKVQAYYSLRCTPQILGPVYETLANARRVLEEELNSAVMTAERQLNYLFHDRINGILPPFLNMGTLGLNYGMQACQFTATSTTAECQTLAMPNYVHSIPNNNDNQDIVSMGTNTALLTKRVIDNAYQVFAIQYIALAQAVDCLGIAEKLAPLSRKVYADIRALVPAFVEDTPFYEEIARVENYLRANSLGLK